MSEKILIAPAGWEERYSDGLIIDIDEFQPNKILIIFSEKYAERTEPARKKIQEKALLSSAKYLEYQFDYVDEVNLYNSVVDLLTQHISECDEIRFNSTTTPRNLIWYILHYLADKKINTQFSYFRPEKYSEEYLSRDAKEPKFVLKCSGIVYPDLPTCILVVSGYDEERLFQLKQKYEPKKMLIGRQTGEQYDNKERNYFNKHEQIDIEYFDFDFYDTSNESVILLSEKLNSFEDEYNIVAASLGPKPSALLLFKLIQIKPDIGLLYIPAGDYSQNYSIGIKKRSQKLEVITWEH
jgi:hypothetical protein